MQHKRGRGGYLVTAPRGAFPRYRTTSPGRATTGHTKRSCARRGFGGAKGRRTRDGGGSTFFFGTRVPCSHCGVNSKKPEQIFYRLQFHRS